LSPQNLGIKLYREFLNSSGIILFSVHFDMDDTNTLTYISNRVTIVVLAINPVLLASTAQFSNLQFNVF